MSSHVRIWLALAATVAFTATVVGPVIAANQTVAATGSNTWSPSTVTVNVGESVHFSNSNDGTHDLRFDGESKSVTPLSTSWTYDRTFPTAGAFGFYCTVHARMTGTVVVQPTTTTSTGTTTSPTGTTTSPTGTTTTPTKTTTTAVASFDTSPKRLRSSKTGRVKYTFRATPLRSGKIAFKSTKKIKIGSTIRFMKLAAKSFTASSTGNAKVTFKLTTTQLRALKRVKRLRMVVTVTLDAKIYTTKLTLKAPTT